MLDFLFKQAIMSKISKESLSLLMCKFRFRKDPFAMSGDLKYGTERNLERRLSLWLKEL